jgi:thymidylate synthase (FAD)
VIHAVPFSLIDTETGADMNDAMYGGAVSEIDALHEFAGRACYKSWDKPNPATATNQGYLEHIEDVKHFSILEHGQVSFYVEDVSRSLLLELERHGRNSHLSFSVESQRYVSTSQHHPYPVTPALFRDAKAGLMGDELERRLWEFYKVALENYDYAYAQARNLGYPVKQAREAARAFLPNSTPVDFVTTADIRGWREVIEKRNDPAADREIQEFAKIVLDHLSVICPNSVQDIPIEEAA